MNKVHVATIKIVKGKGLKAIYTPLGNALAPLGIYLTPFVQDMNYLDRVRFNGRMTSWEFLDILKQKPYMKRIQIKEHQDKESVDVFADEDIVKSSTYADSEFISRIYNTHSLPILFQLD